MIEPQTKYIPFKQGETYSRSQIGEVLDTDGTTKGDWATGYHLHQDPDAGIDGWWFLFPTVGGDGRTGHDYDNKWLNDTDLSWKGKTRSQLGQPQIDKLLSGDFPVLLFTRKDNREPFTYHGFATVVDYEDTQPVTVTWRIGDQTATTIEHNSDDDSQEPEYEPNTDDHRTEALRQIKERRGQNKFRNELLKAFNRKCAISECGIESILEAAHINPYRGAKDNHKSNGILLRCDLHTLFDLSLLGIEPGTHEVHLHPSIQESSYKEFEHRMIKFSDHISEQALIYRWQSFVENVGEM